MIEIITEPPSILIDGIPTTKYKVEKVSESEMNVDLQDLETTKVGEYPDLLITDIETISESKVPLAESYQIYKASGAFHFNIF